MVDKPSKLRIEMSVPERVIEQKKLGDGAQKQAESFVGKYMRNFVSKMYPCLTHCKVGALRSRGNESQFELQGTLHRDYLDDVEKKSQKRDLSQ